MKLPSLSQRARERRGCRIGRIATSRTIRVLPCGPRRRWPSCLRDLGPRCVRATIAHTHLQARPRSHAACSRLSSSCFPALLAAFATLSPMTDAGISTPGAHQALRAATSHFRRWWLLSPRPLAGEEMPANGVPDMRPSAEMGRFSLFRQALRTVIYGGPTSRGSSRKRPSTRRCLTAGPQEGRSRSHRILPLSSRVCR